MVGLACDHLVEIEIVLFDGAIVRANKSNQYQDMLWATCGGGGGLGILTEMTLEYTLLGTDHFSYGTIVFSQQSTISEQAEMVSKVMDYFSSSDNLVFGGEVTFNKEMFELYGMFAASLNETKMLMEALEFDQYVAQYDLYETDHFARASMYFVCMLMFGIASDDSVSNEILPSVSEILSETSDEVIDQSLDRSQLCNASDVQDALLTLGENRSSFVNWGINPAW